MENIFVVTLKYPNDGIIVRAMSGERLAVLFACTMAEILHVYMVDLLGNLHEVDIELTQKSIVVKEPECGRAISYYEFPEYLEED